MKVNDKVVVVTGGGSGIGRALVLELLSRGARVAAADIRPESLQETARLAGAGDRLAGIIVDVSDREAIGQMPDRVVESFGVVDGIISNAGIIQPFVRVNELEYDAIDRVIDVNLYGTIHLTKAFLPHLLERPEAHIAAMSSMGAVLPIPGQTVYGAAKAAIKLLVEGLYTELLDTNVGVTVVVQGAAATNITTNSGIELPEGAADSAEQTRFPTVSPEQAATTIIDGIEANRLHVYVGRDARFFRIAQATAPRRAAQLISQRMKALLDE